MAYAALIPLAQLLEQILDHDQQLIVLHEKQKIKSLHENIIALINFLGDFSGEAGDIEARIRIAANKAEDIIGHHISDELHSEKHHISDEIHSENGCCNVLNCFGQVIRALKVDVSGGHHINWQRLYQELHKSIEEIESILIEMMQIKSSNTRNNLMPTQSSSSSSSRLVPSNKSTIVGFEEDLEEIKARLHGEPSQLQIIPIVGMGGIGKTTLARYAHDDPLCVHHFDVRAWVTVSQNYVVQRILLGLLYCIDASSKEVYEKMDDELLAECVYKCLKRRRYLVVMDDIWNTNVWDEISRIFPNDVNGSRIIITTRELDVAAYIDSRSHPHQIKLMSVDQSWNLLKEKVFAEEDCPPELEKIGKLIAENCRGLPLAVVVIAGVLSKVNQMQDTWTNIARNVNEAVNASDEQFSEILSLSYTHLPNYLRPCFLYIGGFPEDQEINASKLIRLWTAEGFVKLYGSESMEEVGEDYLEDLAKRNLVMVDKKRSNGKIKFVKIHDLLRDLCLRKARDEKFIHVTREFCPISLEGIKNSRRLSICSYFPRGLLNIDYQHLHTILLFNDAFEDSWKHYRFLRVVDALIVNLRSYPVEIGELFHLRYLAFTFEHDGTGEFEVPESLSNLQNLQTLIIRLFGISGFTDTLHLPFGIWRMPQLRHLILVDGFLSDLPIATSWKLSALENLQTLSRVKGFTCSKRILKMIPNIKKLGIFYSFSDIYETGWSKYGLSNLVHLHKLESLDFYAEPFAHSGSEFQQSLAFPVSLKKLTLTGSQLPWEDMTIIGSLPNLEVLKLRRHVCPGFAWETTEGEFCRLKVLVIDSTDLRDWITESSHFPRLERLVLYDCKKLREIPYGIGEIPTLQLIEVDRRNSSIVKSAKCIRAEQYSFGNDLRVRFLRTSPNTKSSW